MATVLFAAAHPDDETLGMGVAIAEHTAAGHDVHVLWLTAGTASGAIDQINGTVTGTWWPVTHDPAAEGYQPLSPADLGVARLAEGDTAVRCLATGLPGTISTHCAYLSDGGVTQSDAYDAILDLADQIGSGGPVRIKAHSHVVDNHADHLAIGAAARQLAVDYPALYGDLRHYILPPYWSDSRLSQVTESPDLPTDAGITARVRHAIRSYGAWSPALGSYAIGYHSVASMLDQLAANPKCMQHP